MCQTRWPNGPGSLARIFEITLAIFFFFGVAFREEFTIISLCPYNASSPNSLISCLLTDQNFANNFWKGSLKKHFYEIISKSEQCSFREEIFFEVCSCLYRESSPHSKELCLMTNQNFAEKF